MLVEFWAPRPGFSPTPTLSSGCDTYDVTVWVQISSSEAPRLLTRRMQHRYAGTFCVTVEVVYVFDEETNLCVSGSGSIRQPVLEKSKVEVRTIAP